VNSSAPRRDHTHAPKHPSWLLLRQDDNGNRYEISRFPTREEAEDAAAKFEARGHKQLYYVELYTPPSTSPH
jgi:hypothetical protein